MASSRYSTMFRFTSFTALLAQLSLCFAQSTSTFTWEFSETQQSAFTLPTCQTLSITLRSLSTTNTSTRTVAPYYMTSYAVNGTAMTTYLGVNASALSWTVSHPVGSELLLNVIDSQGSSGGISPQTYTVIAGQSTGCVQQSSSSFTLLSNSTGELATCQPLGVWAEGGAKPYTITLLQPGSPTVTNVTFAPASDDAFVYINRAAPNTTLLATISDSQGRWANGAVLLKTTGTSDFECAGLTSVSGNASQLGLVSTSTPLTSSSIPSASVAADSAGKTGRKINGGVIAGIIIAIIGFLAIAGALCFVYQKRRTRTQSALSVQQHPNAHHSESSVFDINMRQLESGLPETRDNHQTSPSTVSPFPLSPRQRSGTEFSYTSKMSPSAGTSGEDLSFGYQSMPRSGVSEPQTELSIAPETIVQHYDAGPIRELPPPYMARST